jgi:NAD-dependent deacetylase
MSEDIQQLARLIDEASRVVVFTGAGISTESGIPDFRSPNGIWSRTPPIYFGEYVASADARIEAWRRKFEIDRDMIGAEPNRGHRAVAKLVRTGKVSAVITQNIDGLHQESGVPDDRMIELHGNGTYATCLSCAARYELEPIRAAFEADNTLPVCDDCGGIVKTATISFGQAMPEGPMDRAREETLACDLFLAVGSSLVVYPAAGFPAMAKQNDAGLVIVNRDPTDLDRIADLVLNREIGPTLGEAANVN